MPQLPEFLDHALADFAGMVRFYSRVAVPQLSPSDDPGRLPAFARAVRMLPLSGAVILVPGAVVLALLGASDLSSLTVAALCVAVTTAVTGAFHEDGFADVADGFGGGATRERRLEIMKDSRIGAFGGAALVVQFVLRTALVADLLDRVDGPAAAVVTLGLAGLVRVLPLGLMVATPAARPDGLARAVGAPTASTLAVAGLGAAALFLAATLPFLPLANVVAAPIAAAGGLVGLAALAKCAIGGHTGDVIGAGTLIAEIAALVALLA
ncbi:adenosylcobinamide-GDP ribazoletransferase [Siculibacillus lacustris]|uniref:Adenosylcobinamide-GDP ribazoletransferase n=1 Tax=Siculibacillus lacustris TaxID=1549641 RepID=A0A4Q9VX36_9HYPH|nr:adenosylcobinamide-GDP ribazoletransferase [Siculibacillus lacustris]TBW40938.1 adenosylcobinamide-GDP ribazoletransferase [Siculibacillus lacustris]